MKNILCTIIMLVCISSANAAIPQLVNANKACESTVKGAIDAIIDIEQLGEAKLKELQSAQTKAKNQEIGPLSAIREQHIDLIKGKINQANQIIKQMKQWEIFYNKNKQDVEVFVNTAKSNTHFFGYLSNPYHPERTKQALDFITGYPKNMATLEDAISARDNILFPTFDEFARAQCFILKGDIEKSHKGFMNRYKN